MVPHSSPVARQPRTVPTSLYLYYDVNDTLIYIGITDRGISRNREHNTRAEFWPFVARQEVEHFARRADAAARERELIKLYLPPFNKQHNPYYADVRAEYLAWATSPPSDPIELARSLSKRLPLRVIAQDDARLVLSTHLEHAAVARLVRPPTSEEQIYVAGHSARVSSTHQRNGLLVVEVKPRTVLFPSVASGEAGFKFESLKPPPTIRLTAIHVTPENARSERAVA